MLELADDAAEVDIEGADDKMDDKKKLMSSCVEEVTVEEFFVKYKNL